MYRVGGHLRYLFLHKPKACFFYFVKCSTIIRMAKDSIKFVRGREILDSRGVPTIEVTVALDGGVAASASVPSGTSTGEHEAWELRDNDPNRYNGQGVLQAALHVNQDIAATLAGEDVHDQREIDQKLIELDGTPNKGRLGANAILGASLACARAASIFERAPLYEYLRETYSLSDASDRLPVPMFNIFNGGKHADTNLDIQEFMIVPSGVKGAREQVRVGAQIIHRLGRFLTQAGLDTDVGSEGGYAPDLDSSVDALKYIVSSIEGEGLTPGPDVSIALDVGSSTFYDESKHEYIFKIDESFLTTDQMISLYLDWVKKYPISFIEDGLDENDWIGWRQMTEELTREKNMLVVGDDIFVTNVEKLQKGVNENVGNAIVLKPNQVGTLSETVRCSQFAQKHDYKVVVSQRSGDTTDDFLADLSVAIGADFLKAGSLMRGERVSKYNRLMAIEEDF